MALKENSAKVMKERKMKINKEFILREIAGDYVLVPVGPTVNDYTGLFPMTETGARIWELLPLCDSEEDIVKTLAKEYDVQESVLREDVKEFLEKLRGYGII